VYISRRVVLELLSLVGSSLAMLKTLL